MNIWYFVPLIIVEIVFWTGAIIDGDKEFMSEMLVNHFLLVACFSIALAIVGVAMIFTPL